jgi:hypothetical protein
MLKYLHELHVYNGNNTLRRKPTTHAELFHTVLSDHKKKFKFSMSYNLQICFIAIIRRCVVQIVLLVYDNFPSLFLFNFRNNRRSFARD